MSNPNFITEQGIIKSVDDFQLSIICQSKVNCIRCESGNGCGGGILAKWLGNRQIELSVPYYQNNSKFQPRVGDFVEVNLPASTILKFASLIYIVPLVIVAICLILLSKYSHAEPVLVFSALVLLVSSHLAVKKLLAHFIKNNHLHLTISSISAADINSMQGGEINCSLEKLKNELQK